MILSLPHNQPQPPFFISATGVRAAAIRRANPPSAYAASSCRRRCTQINRQDLIRGLRTSIDLLTSSQNKRHGDARFRVQSRRWHQHLHPNARSEPPLTTRKTLVLPYLRMILLLMREKTQAGNHLGSIAMGGPPCMPSREGEQAKKFTCKYATNY